MTGGDIVIDLCSGENKEKLKEKIRASKAFWTSKQNGYSLISDEEGPDMLIVNKSFEIVDNKYIEAPADYAIAGSVILVYQRVGGPPKKKKEA